MKRGKRGMTLVELIVAVAFTAVIIAAACTALYVGAHSFQSGSSNAFSQQKAALAESYLQRYAATAVSVSPSVEQSKNGVIFEVRDNILHVTQQTVSAGGITQKEVVSVNGISRIEITVGNGSLNYVIVSEDKTYRLTGGIVLNNDPSAAAASFSVQDGAVLFLEP